MLSGETVQSSQPSTQGEFLVSVAALPPCAMLPWKFMTIRSSESTL